MGGQKSTSLIFIDQRYSHPSLIFTVIENGWILLSESVFQQAAEQIFLCVVFIVFYLTFLQFGAPGHGFDPPVRDKYRPNYAQGECSFVAERLRGIVERQLLFALSQNSADCWRSSPAPGAADDSGRSLVNVRTCDAVVRADPRMHADSAHLGGTRPEWTARTYRLLKRRERPWSTAKFRVRWRLIAGPVGWKQGARLARGTFGRSACYCLSLIISHAMMKIRGFPVLCRLGNLKD